MYDETISILLQFIIDISFVSGRSDFLQKVHIKAPFICYHLFDILTVFGLSSQRKVYVVNAFIEDPYHAFYRFTPSEIRILVITVA